MKTFVLLLYFFRVCLCEIVRQDVSFELKERTGSNGLLHGTLERIVKTYHCYTGNVRNEQIILYGTKGWIFPAQDVNLTLQYPSTNPENYSVIDSYVITSFLVILYIDSTESRGYVTEGGTLKEHISLSFVMKNISRLSYQFWMYGVSKDLVNITENTWQQNFC